MGPVWRKWITSLKDSDYILEVRGSHGRLFRREVAGGEQEDEYGQGVWGGSVRSAGVDMIWCHGL